MKKLSVSALALVVALCAASAAHADTTPGWYVGAGVGAAFGIDPDLKFPAGKVGAEDETVGLDLLGNVGYAWNNGLRVEGEYFHNQTNIDKVGTQTGPSGHVINNALFANVLYDISTGTRFTPYVGAGVGPDFVSVSSVGANGSGFLKGDTLVGAYQGIAGVAAKLDSNWDVTADYRYVASFDPKVDATAGGQGRLDNASHNVVLGLRYNFNCAPAPVAASAPLVAAHAAKRTAGITAPNFTVFFDFNKSVITPEAHRIIAAAAAEYKKSGAATIAVTGHTDTVGSDAYNEKLSVRRAKAVEAELAKMGVSTQNITESGVGKSELLVPTANGVREAQNRRAEIVLGGSK